MKPKTLVLFLLMFLSLPASMWAQQTGWVVRLILPKSEYLPGEPISPIRLEMQNLGPDASPFPRFQGGLYLDGNTEPCLQKGLCPDFPPRGPGLIELPPKPEPVGSLHVQEGTADLARLCELTDQRKDFYGPHTICYRFPEATGIKIPETCVRFTILRPLGADAEAYKYFKADPLKHGEEVIKKYPTSNYAALALWGQGLTWYNSEGTMPEIGAEKDFDFYNLERKASSPLSFEECLRQVRTISAPWEKLYNDFPDFAYRSQLLFGLARCYLHLGERQKAAPLIQELLAKFPDSEPGKKAVAYRNVLKTHGLWPE